MINDKNNRCNNTGQTPKHVVDYMISRLQQFDIQPGKHILLEPTQGLGNISSALTKNGFIFDSPEDFFILERQHRAQDLKKYDAIVMNPPFSSKTTDLTNCQEPITGLQVGYYILERCLQMSDVVIAIMPIFTLSDSDNRRKKLEAFGLKHVTFLPRKTFNYTRINTCILELQKGFKGDTTQNSLWF